MADQITIEVTDEDVLKGVPGECDYCPIAIAMQRVLLQPISVHDLGWNRMGEGKSYPLPASAHAFMRKFDDDEKPEPFTFTIDRPDWFKPSAA